jgi:hypothetical protein
VFAFESNDAAKQFVKKNGGKVMNYEGLLTKLARQVNADPKAKKPKDDFGTQLMN